MSPTRKADVIVALDCDQSPDLRCLEAVLERSGPALNRLIIVDGHGPETLIARDLGRFAGRDRRIRVLASDAPIDLVRSCNHGLRHRAGDAVLLSADGMVGDDWLIELAAVAHSEERTACVSPLTELGLSRRTSGGDLGPEEACFEQRDIRIACAGLPRWTIAPPESVACIYLRGDVIDAVGLLDTDLTSASAAVHDWATRAQSLGFSAKRANHVYVRRSGAEPTSVQLGDGPDGPAAGLAEPRFEPFRRTLDGNLAAFAVEMRSTGKVRVAFDVRHLPDKEVGTRTYAVCLAQALARLPEVDLALLVHEPAQARGMSGRVVTEDRWCDDAMIVHRPAQVFHPRELRLLFGSSAHVVITYQDLIGYRIPHVFSTDAEFDGYRATSSLTLPAVQRILAYSENAANEITTEFGIPRKEIAVVPLGVEAGLFARRDEADASIRQELGLPPRYFLSLATDFPHKNLHNLLDAYASLRSRWRGGDPPGLVLAGHTTTTRTGLYRRMESGPMVAGLSFLGPVTPDQLRILYQDALALVFPSLYEGFGLPPLEAMAAGTPVIAMPISSIPEVAGDCVFYPVGLSSVDLARAMEAVARDEGLRAEFRERGLCRVDRFRWERTARATVDAYRSAILNPSPRSLQMRRHLQNALMSWGEPVFESQAPAIAVASETAPPEPLGIRDAWQALNSALHRRLRRELGRFHPLAGRRSA